MVQEGQLEKLLAPSLQGLSERALAYFKLRTPASRLGGLESTQSKTWPGGRGPGGRTGCGQWSVMAETMWDSESEWAATRIGQLGLDGKVLVGPVVLLLLKSRSLSPLGGRHHRVMGVQRVWEASGMCVLAHAAT